MQVWSGAPTYIEAAIQYKIPMNYMFFRMTCKSPKTVLKKLREAVLEEKEYGGYSEYFHGEGAQYEVISTPNGYDGDEVVSRGFISDLLN